MPNYNLQRTRPISHEFGKGEKLAFNIYICVVWDLWLGKNMILFVEREERKEKEKNVYLFIYMLWIFFCFWFILQMVLCVDFYWDFNFFLFLIYFTNEKKERKGVWNKLSKCVFVFLNIFLVDANNILSHWVYLFFR